MICMQSWVSNHNQLPKCHRLFFRRFPLQQSFLFLSIRKSDLHPPPLDSTNLNVNHLYSGALCLMNDPLLALICADSGRPPEGKRLIGVTESCAYNDEF